ncbi:MAG TPA: glycosyltransferase family 1 protein [Planctomycetota bacterium]|nr:glycosyltransferase family 1 protein [Planctomycetota bacterium]
MTRTAETKTGLGSYGRSLVAAMARLDTANRYLLHPFVQELLPADHRRAFCPQQPNFRVARWWVPGSVIAYLWKQPWVSRDRLVGGNPDVFFGPFHYVPERHHERQVSAFMDVSFRVHPEFSTQLNVDHCELHFARARRLADKLITISHFSKREIVKHMGVPEDWVVVTQLAADPVYRRLEGCTVPERIRGKVDSTRDMILYVGSIEPRKNLATLVRAYDALLQRGKCRAMLVIAGGSGWKNSDVHAEIERRGLVDQICFTGFVTDAELVALYNTATVFVFPTIYEGFGLPVIEAMACGAPVVTTRVSSIPEVGGDAVAYVDDPVDDAGLCLRLEEVLQNRELQLDLRQRGFRQAATFTWERTARETLAVLQSVHEDPRYARRQVVMGSDERGLVAGWHGIESDAGTAYRWSDRQGRARLRLSGDTLSVVASTPVPERRQRLIARVDGRRLGARPLDHEWRTLEFPTEGRVRTDREVDVTLTVNVELPESIKGADRRHLGARVARISGG